MRSILFSMAAFSMTLGGVAVALAGAGADMKACVNLAVKPAQPITFNFTAGSHVDHCMNDTGHDATLKVDAAGVHCVDVGYIEEKGSSSGGDTCATDTSTWVLGYDSEGQSYSGTVQAHMSHPIFGSNHIYITEQSTGTYVCPDPYLCTSTSQTWDSGSLGPLYMIFEIGADN